MVLMAGSCVGMRGSTSHAEYGESLLQAPLNGGLVIGAQSWQLSPCPPRLRLLHSFTDIASCVLSPYVGSGPGAPEEAARLLS